VNVAAVEPCGLHPYKQLAHSGLGVRALLYLQLTVRDDNSPHGANDIRPGPSPFRPFRDYGGAMARPPFWRESRVGLETAALLRSPVFRGEGVEDGRGRPVLLVPGFLAGDDSLALMTRWLRRAGYHTRKAGIRANVGCSAAIVERIEDRLEELVQRQGQRAAIIGQSRGGTFARVLARRRPDLVSGVVTLGTPHVEPLAIHPVVGLQLIAVGALGTLGAPGFFSRSCLKGDCCAEFWEQIEAPLPRRIGFVSVYSRTDGVVDWRACLAPGARHVEIGSSHIGMAVNAAAYCAVADGLESFRWRERSHRPRASVTRLPRAA
jgi:triacylglycerol lipase